MRLTSVLESRGLARGVALLLVTAVTMGFGCDSSNEQVSASPGGSKTLAPDEARYRYEGEGKNKKKIQLSPKERRKAVAEAKQKLEGN